MTVSCWGQAPGWRDPKHWRSRSVPLLLVLPASPSSPSFPFLPPRRNPIRSREQNPGPCQVFVWDGDIYGHRFYAVDDTGGGVGVNLGEGAQKQAGDIGENGGT